MTSNSSLDGDEYLHLAMHASSKGDHHAALTYLKSALAIDPDNVAAQYLLAAEHAELGLFRRARTEFERVIELKPDMEIARFQLGLLHMQLDEETAAVATFAHLAEFAGDASLQAFSRGMNNLLRGADGDGIALIREGLATCVNDPLRSDMMRVLTSAETRLANTEHAPATDRRAVDSPVAEQAPTRASIFLGAYRDAAKNDK